MSTGRTGAGLAGVAGLLGPRLGATVLGLCGSARRDAGTQGPRAGPASGATVWSLAASRTLASPPASPRAIHKRGRANSRGEFNNDGKQGRVSRSHTRLRWLRPAPPGAPDRPQARGRGPGGEKWQRVEAPRANTSAGAKEQIRGPNNALHRQSVIAGRCVAMCLQFQMLMHDSEANAANVPRRELAGLL